MYGAVVYSVHIIIPMFCQSLAEQRFLKSLPIYLELHSLFGGQGSSVGTATCYDTDSSGLKPRWGQKMFSFLQQSRPALGPSHPPVKLVKSVCPSGKSAAIWRWPTISSNTDVKERVELYIYSPSMPPCYGMTFTFTVSFYYSYYGITDRRPQ